MWIVKESGRQSSLWVCERRRGKVVARARRGEKKVMGRGVTELPCGCVEEEGGLSGNRAKCGRELVFGRGIDKLTIGMELRKEVGSFSVGMSWHFHLYSIHKGALLQSTVIFLIHTVR